MSPRTLFRPPVPTADGDRRMTPTEHAQHRQDRDDWWNATSIAQMGRLTADWLEGRRYFLPGYAAAGPAAETRDLTAHLAAYNRAGFLTISSQPGHGPREGYDGRMWLQRAYVSGYTDVDTIHSLGAALAEHHDDITLWCLPVRQGPRKPELDRDYFPVTLRENDDTATTGDYDVNTVAGLTPNRRHVKGLYRGDLNPAAIKMLQGAWHVTISDNGYHQDDRLWTVLADWAKQRQEAAA
jgi:hypothetical protein